MHLQVHGAAKAALSAATAIARAGLAAGSPEPAELARKRPSMQLLPKLLELACCLRAAACLSIARSSAYKPTAAYFKVAYKIMLLKSKVDDKGMCCYMTGVSPLPSVRLTLSELHTQSTHLSKASALETICCHSCSPAGAAADANGGDLLQMADMIGFESCAVT